MYELTIEQAFASAHQLRGYKGKCENLHGHNFKVIVSIKAAKLNDIDLAIDFHDMKRITADVLGRLDHKVLNEVPPFDKLNPSSENLAKWLYETLKAKFEDGNIKMSSVTVWESSTASARYYED